MICKMFEILKRTKRTLSSVMIITISYFSCRRLSSWIWTISLPTFYEVSNFLFCYILGNSSTFWVFCSLSLSLSSNCLLLPRPVISLGSKTSHAHSVQVSLTQSNVPAVQSNPPLQPTWHNVPINKMVYQFLMVVCLVFWSWARFRDTLRL